MKTRVTLIASLVLAMGVIATGCKNKRDTPEPIPEPEKKEQKEPTPTPEAKEYKIGVEAYLKVDGKLVLLQPLGEDKGDYEYGVISGEGTYKEGREVSIYAEIKDFMKHTLVALYEKDEKGGFTKATGMVDQDRTENTLTMKREQMAEIHLNAKEDMTFVAVFEEYSAPALKIDNIYGHEYWVQKNREAMNYIKPRIRRYNDIEEAKRVTGFAKMHPTLDVTQIKRTVYQYSSQLFDLNGAPERPPYRITDGDFEKAYRYTYCLTTLDGNDIVEIFPPSYSATGGNFPQLNYITVPEGTYRVALLVNFPKDRETWHLIPMMPTFSLADEYYGKDYGWRAYDPLPPHQNWYRDGDIIYVKNRSNNQIATPVWDDDEIKLLGEKNCIEESSVDITLTITNVTNQRMEGKVIVADGYSRWWHEEGRQLMDMRMQKVWMKEPKQKHPYESWENDRAEQMVRLLPNEKVTIKLQLKNRTYNYNNDPYDGDLMDYRHLNLPSGSGVHTVFYWQDTTKKERLFMTKGNAKELAIMQERNWGSLGSKHIGWWSGVSIEGFNRNDCVFNLLCPAVEGNGTGNTSFCRNAIVFDH
ncbi:hypothetical protein [Porphyromonas levii]|uniref:Fimbrillin family protein n=1 Tax=Porphyromonas levii TaxID=28114 RepID=A0A4Y8WMF3_9PORP|nr:hypothetical protein [Porphyromonas levii]TFH94167.1 hypothetical protein E4P47_08680 [Porphyromonas levii]TFH96682.1 hypothetical protein E4P48_03805 [Porphyromonas levii]